MLHVKTNSQIADLLTKALNAQQFSFLVSKLNMVNIHAPLPLEGGGVKIQKEVMKQLRGAESRAQIRSKASISLYSRRQQA